MVVVPQYHNRLGNNISQYAFPRLVAEHLGFAFHAPPLMGVATELPGESYRQPASYISDFDNKRVDADEIMSDRSPRMLVMEGHFQQGKLYEAHRDKIREWFATSLKPADSDGCAVVHVRGGDYAYYGWYLPVSYYAYCALELASLGCKRCIVCTDCVDWEVAPYLQALELLRPVAVCFGAPLKKDFELLMGAKYVICGNSTFSWWAAFLGKAERVYMPHNWQPWGIGQRGDRLLGQGVEYPSDLRVNLPGWHIVDMAGGNPK